MDIQVEEALTRFENNWNRTRDAYWEGVFQNAFDIFKLAGMERDFCLQSVGHSVIFGGWNRLIWNREHSKFYASKSHCTQDFLDHVETLDNVEAML